MSNVVIVNNRLLEMHGNFQNSVVHVAGGTFANGTVVSNASDQAGWCVRATGGALKNCIVRNNRSVGQSGDAIDMGAKATITYSCTAEPVDGEGNLTADPKFRRRDYRIGCSSPCARSGEGRTYMGYAPPVQDGLLLVR